MTIILSSRNVWLCLLIIFTLIFSPAIPASADHEEASCHLPENVKTPELSSLIDNIEKPDSIQTDAQHFSNSITDAHSNSTNTTPEKQTSEVQFTSYDDADIEGSPPATGLGDRTGQDPDVLNDNSTFANPLQQLNPESKVNEDNQLYIPASFSADLQQSAAILSDSLPDPFEDMQKDGDYWLIETFSHLDAVRNALSDKYRLANNIDISEITNWSPIGTYSSNPFRGVFDGAGFTITGLMINKDQSHAGLFGYIRNATIVDLHLRDVSINAGSGSYVGGIAGWADDVSFFENCSVQGIITGKGNSMGGLVGYAKESVFNNCFADCDVIGLSNSSYNGGLIGTVRQESNINNCYSLGSVSGKDHIGGLFGRVSGVTNSESLKNTITNCYTAAIVDSNGLNVGGFSGSNHPHTIINRCYWDKEASGQELSIIGIGKSTEEMKIEATYENWDFASIWFIEEGVSYPILRWQLEGGPSNPDDSDDPDSNPGEGDGDGDDGAGGPDDDDIDLPGEDSNDQSDDDSNDYYSGPSTIYNVDLLMMFNQAAGFNTAGLFFKLLSMIRQVEKLIALILETVDHEQTDIQAEIDLLFAEITELFETNRHRLSPAEEKIILDKLEAITAAQKAL